MNNTAFHITNDTDLHMHTSYSDGSDSVCELLDKILATAIHTFSITDHDSILGNNEMIELIKTQGININYIPGVELSCVSPKGKCHILGYNYDNTNIDLLNLLDNVKNLRRNNLDKRIDFLKEVYSIAFDKEEIDWLYSLNNAGKPHLARLLIKKGYATTVSEAITRYLLACDTVSAKIEASKAIKTIIGAGGIPVWAHPLGGEGEKRTSLEDFNSLFNELLSLGIKGLECYYSRYTYEEIDFLKETAASNGLITTGGSDYHGLNKNIALGTLCHIS